MASDGQSAMSFSWLHDGREGKLMGGNCRGADPTVILDIVCPSNVMDEIEQNREQLPALRLCINTGYQCHHLLSIQEGFELHFIILNCWCW